MKHYHNSYWFGYTNEWRWICKIFHLKLNNDIFKSVEDGSIIEVDLICRDGKLLISHTPVKPTCLCYGDLNYYFAKMLTHLEKELYLYIEIKTSDYKTKQLVANLIETYNGRIKILIGGIDKWFSRKRKYIATEIYFANTHNNVEMFDSFKMGKTIKIIDLYKNKFWRLNHW